MNGDSKARFWRRLVWLLVFPQGGPRIAPTVSGIVLVALAMGIGSAAYNSANNILFITLSLLLSCLILSGVLSTLNFRRVTWNLNLVPPFRAGSATSVSLDIANAKSFLPTYGLWFDVSAAAKPSRFVPFDGTSQDTSLDSSGKKKSRKSARSVSERLANYGKGRVRERLFLRGRMDAGGGTRLDWIFKPARRGVQRIALDGVGSLFPFGFLKKSMGSGLWRDVIVWPASVEYRSWGAAAGQPQAAGERVARMGAGSDLFALRKYETGDSHRLIHWKASARMRQLFVRQFAAENQDAYSLWLRTPADVWTRPEQFELLVGFAATLAEDLFRAGKLRSVAIDSNAPRAVNRVRDLEAFLDELAVVGTSSNHIGDGGEGFGSGKNLLTFAPDGPHGVVALFDGVRMAAT